MLGVFSSSAGSLVVLGLVLLLAAALLWRRGIARRWWTVSAAAGLVLAAPYLGRYFGRGIAPPAGGGSLLEPIGFWGPRAASGGGGREDDPAAVALLDRMGHELPAPGPRTAGELYALWLRSPLAAQDYPASLAVWTRSGDPVAELRLARLDLRPPLMAALVRSPDTRRGPRVERLERVPGVHNVLVAPLASGDVLTVGVGPRTLLIAADRVARFLQGDIGAGLPYVPTLSLPSPGPPAESARVIWTRTGWSVRGERRLELSGGVRHVHLRVDLQPGGPWALLVRGALVVVLDAGLLGAVWLASLLLVAGGRPRLPPLLPRLRPSDRVRLTAALAGFFVVPVMAFALWSFAQPREDARQDGDLLIRQTLRDAVTTAGDAVSDPATNVDRAVSELADRLDADLWLYQDGVLTATSAPVLDELGLADPFLAPEALVRFALRDELEVSADGSTAGRPVRVGDRVVVAR